MLKAGEFAFDRNTGKRVQVLERLEVWGYVSYRVFDPSMGTVYKVMADGLSDSSGSNTYDENYLRYVTLLSKIKNETAGGLLTSLASGVIPLPHQLHVLNRVMSTNNIRYILADEITAWLDAPLANQLLEQLREQCEQGAGVLWVTHDLTLAARHADRIVALHQGRVSDNVSREQLLRGEISEHLQRQWRALPERNQLFGERDAVLS